MARYTWFIFILAFPSVSLASGSMSYADFGEKLTNVPCSASENLRSITTPSASALGYAVANFQINLTRTAATAVIMKCYASMDSNQTYAQFQTCSVTSGVCQSSDASWTKTVTASTNWIWRVDFLGNSDVRCIVECLNGTPSDLITARLRVMDY